MVTMKLNKIYVGIIVLSVIVVSFGILSYHEESDYDVQYFTPTVKLADARAVDIITPPELCTDLLNDLKKQHPGKIKTLRMLPDGYKLTSFSGDFSFDSDGISAFTFYESGDTECGSSIPGSPSTHGMISIMIQTYDDSEFDTMAQLIAWVAEKIRIENRTNVIEINGYMTWAKPPKLATEEVLFKNGTVLHTQKVTRPGYVTVLDEESDLVYRIEGYFSLDDLKIMAESLR